MIWTNLKTSLNWMNCSLMNSGSNYKNLMNLSWSCKSSKHWTNEMNYRSLSWMNSNWSYMHLNCSLSLNHRSWSNCWKIQNCKNLCLSCMNYRNLRSNYRSLQERIYRSYWNWNCMSFPSCSYTNCMNYKSYMNWSWCKYKPHDLNPGCPDNWHCMERKGNQHQHEAVLQRCCCRQHLFWQERLVIGYRFFDPIPRYRNVPPLHLPRKMTHITGSHHFW